MHNPQCYGLYMLDYSGIDISYSKPTFNWKFIITYSYRYIEGRLGAIMPIMFLFGLSSVLPKISSIVPLLSITLMLLATQLSVVTHAKFTCESDICIAKPELSITTDVNGRCFSNAYRSVCRCMVSYDWSQSLWNQNQTKSPDNEKNMRPKSPDKEN